MAGSRTGNFSGLLIHPPLTDLSASFNPTNGILSFTAIAAPALNYTHLAGGALQLSWTGNFKLQSQTNTLVTGLGTNWFDHPGGGDSPVTITNDPSHGARFFRLSTP